MALGNGASNFESGLLKHIFMIVVFSFSREIAFGYDMRCEMAFLYKIFLFIITTLSMEKPYLHAVFGGKSGTLKSSRKPKWNHFYARLSDVIVVKDFMHWVRYD